jgi:hypothetical protein
MLEQKSRNRHIAGEGMLLPQIRPRKVVLPVQSLRHARR